MITFDEIEKADVSQLSVKKRVEAFYKGTDAISSFAKKDIIPVLGGQLNLDKKEEAVAGTYYRMFGWIRSMVVMNHRIHFQGAAAAARSLFELLLDLKYLSDEGSSKWVEKFHAFPGIERYRVAERLIRFHDNHEDSSDKDVSRQREYINAPGRTQEFEKTIVAVWGATSKAKIKPPDHWTGKRIKDRATAFGSIYEEMYYDAYPLLSWYIHSGSTGYAGLKAETMELVFCRSHIIAQNCFLEATKICARELKIADAVEGFESRLEDLRLTAGRVIINEQINVIEQAGKMNST